MKNKFTTTLCGFILSLLLTSCGQTQPDSAAYSKTEIAEAKQDVKTKEELLADSLASAQQIKQDKISDAEKKKKLNLAIRFAEKDFFTSLKAVDRDYGENNFSKIYNTLKRHKRTSYEIYLELTEIRKRAVSVARVDGVEMGANGRERILHNYYSILERELKAKESEFKGKYGFDNRLLLCFRNNYCSCLGDNSDKYCSGRKPIFQNAEFWN